MENYFKFKKVWKLTPKTQIGIILFCYFFLTIWGYFEYQKTGLLFQLPLKSTLVFAPIYEEIIFRGLILGALVKTVSWRKAIIYSSLLFGIWHFKNIYSSGIEATLWQAAYTSLFLGPIFGYITYKTKTIWPTVILHYLNNIWSPISFILLDLIH
jgi:membrane protease YdiL (CAAX protease family)